MPSQKSLVILAFSGGGNIFYRWVTTQNVRNRIEAAFALAAFHQCSKGFFRLPNIRRPLIYNNPAIQTEDITASLRFGSLAVLLAENDTLIERGDAEFDPRSIADGTVNQEVVFGTDHITICDNEKTHEYILRRLNEILGQGK